MTKVKICGITSARDALWAIKAGADALGFIFADSSRKVTVEQVAKIQKQLPPLVPIVGVFVNAPTKEVLAAIKACHLAAIQLHGEEDDNYCNFFKKYCKIVKTIRIKDKSSLQALRLYKNADAFLFDTYQADAYGGTGKIFSIDAIIDLNISKPIIIAGGLKKNNVKQVIQQINPFAVDVSSGVEKSPGKKSESLMIDFIRVVRKVY